MSPFKQIILTALVSFAILFGACDSQPEKEQDSRPNIIFIMPDDQAVRTVSAYEGAINQTPNIDRLAEEGAIFRNSFVTNSICNPSRAAILTGKHSHKNGVVGNASPWDNSQPNLPQLMQDEGYTTVHIGKWHLNNPPEDEFDHSDRLTGAGKQGFYYNPEFVTVDGDTTEAVSGHSTDLVVDKTLNWLDGNSGKEKPFILFVQFKAPHVPRMPEFRFLDRYANDTISVPETLFDDYETRAPYAAKANMKIHYRPLPPLEKHDPDNNIYYARMTDEQLEKWHGYKDPESERFREMQGKDEKELKKLEYQLFIKDYLRLIDGVDENVGRLLDWLDEHRDVSDNTMVVFTSDQGYFTGEHGWAEKRFMYEESIRIPLLVRWPGHVEAGTEIDKMVQNIDFAPTFLDAAGITIPDEMQGRSFVPLLREEQPSDWRQSIYYHYYDHGLHGVPRHDGVRTGRYKLIHFYTDDVWEFYDLENDPHEINNLYGNDEYDTIIEIHKTELNRIRDYYEVPDSHFQPPYVKAGKGQKL